MSSKFPLNKECSKADNTICFPYKYKTDGNRYKHTHTHTQTHTQTHTNTESHTLRDTHTHRDRQTHTHTHYIKKVIKRTLALSVADQRPPACFLLFSVNDVCDQMIFVLMAVKGTFP